MLLQVKFMKIINIFRFLFRHVVSTRFRLKSGLKLNLTAQRNFQNISQILFDIMINCPLLYLFSNFPNTCFKYFIHKHQKQS